MHLRPLAFLALAATLSLASPASAEPVAVPSSHLVQLSAESLAPMAELPNEDKAMATTLSAALDGRWAVAGAGVLLLVLLALRKVGGAFVPALASDVGGAALAAGAGAVLTVLELLQQQRDPTMALVLVAAASGFWAWARKLGLVGLVLRALGKSTASSPPTPPAE